MSEPNRSDYRDCIRGLLEMLAMMPESIVAVARIDPYGTIGDALDLIGEPREPDPWIALHRLCGFPDPPPPEDWTRQP